MPDENTDNEKMTNENGYYEIMRVINELNSLIPPLKIRFDEICNCKWDTCILGIWASMNTMEVHSLFHK